MRGSRRGTWRLGSGTVCGIAGILERDREVRVDRDRLERAAKLLHHRGPDGSAVWSEPGVGFAHTRLAIIDIEGGSQPMHSADGRYVVVFNGEIYNHRELRRDLEAAGYRFRTRSDTEVLLYLYDLLGPRMVDKLRGMFAFVVYDRRERRALLARDRFGKKPLCYAETTQGLAFASTTDALLPLLDGRPDVDVSSIARYLVLQYIPAPHTVYRGVRKVPPGSAVGWAPDRTWTTTYWRPPVRDGWASDAEAAVERVRSVIRDAVRARLESEVPLGVFLSGGIDSSIVVAEMAAVGPTPRTFSVGFADARFDETSYARVVAERFATQHTELVPDTDASALFDGLVDAYDEPFADSSALATLAVARAARDHVTVVLTGDGGDEMFGGYERYLWYRRLARARDRLGRAAGPAAASASAIGHLLRRRRLKAGAEFLRDPWIGYRDRLFHFGADEVRDLLTPDALRQIDERTVADGLDALWVTGTLDVRALMWIDEQTYLPGDLLVKMDRATMEFGLEARSPLLDDRIAAESASLSESLLFDEHGGNAILRRAYADVLPAAVLTRPKMGFGIPVAEWLRSALRPAVEDLLLAPRNPLSAWLDERSVASVVGRFLDGDDDARWRTWNLLALAGWAAARGQR